MNSGRLSRFVPCDDRTDEVVHNRIDKSGLGLAVRDLVKHFGDVAAVDNISFSVPGGSFLTLLGPSGSGKTTVLRLIGGFELPDQGAIEIGGTEVTRLPPHRRDIGMVFQRYALFPHMTVAENVAFSLKQRGVERTARDARVTEVLDAIGLSGYGDRFPAHLSGGQQQRVALGRALAFKPRILVMDEPLAALDKRLRQHLQREIRALQRHLGITTVYVTHDQSEAFVMSDHIAVMNAGRIEQIGTPRALYDMPRTEFVAEFVGDSNLFHCEALSDGVNEGAARLPDGTVLRYPLSGSRSVRVTLLVRPEKMDIREHGTAAASVNVLHGRIVDSTFLGDALEYRVSAGNQEVIVRQQNSPRSKVHLSGEEIDLVWDFIDTIPL